MGLLGEKIKQKEVTRGFINDNARLKRMITRHGQEACVWEKMVPYTYTCEGINMHTHTHINKP